MIRCLLLTSLVLGAFYASVSDSTVNFTHSYYDALLSELEKPRYLVLNISGFIRLAEKSQIPDNRVVVILRHDVDLLPNASMWLSYLEKRHNITSTFYIRTRGPYSISEGEVSQWIRWLSRSGFEVGLHHEDLYHTNYSFTEAVRLFRMDLESLRRVSPVITVCSHGNLQEQKYANYEIFTRNYTTLQEHHLIGEAYITVPSHINSLKRISTYFSDTGGTWKPWLTKLVRAQQGEVVYYLLHPNYWQSTTGRNPSPPPIQATTPPPTQTPIHTPSQTPTPTPTPTTTPTTPLPAAKPKIEETTSTPVSTSPMSRNDNPFETYIITAGILATSIVAISVYASRIKASRVVHKKKREIMKECELALQSLERRDLASARHHVASLKKLKDDH